MATFNWTFKPGIPNKYGITIENSADDVRPNNACYVALFGNDSKGNGSRQKPFKTIKHAMTTFTNTYCIVSSGVYREADLPNTYGGIIGDGDVSIDFSFFNTNLSVSGAYHPMLFNIKLVGGGGVRVGTNSFNGWVKDCIYEGCVPANTIGYSSGVTILGNIIKDTFTPFNLTVYDGTNVTKLEQNTFVRNGLITLNGDNTNFRATRIVHNIFYRCNIALNGTFHAFTFRNCLFYECNFIIGSTPDSAFGVYPNIPVGFTHYTDIEQLKSDYMTAFPNADNPFRNSIIADPKFNNVQIGDFSLKLDSPAKNLSYFGTYVGAKSIGYPIKAATTDAESGFDASTNINLSINDDSIVLTDPSLDASIVTKVIPNLKQRELSEAPLFGFNADRNGQYIDSIADLSDEITEVGTNLKPNTPYIVEVASITNNGNVFLPGERFTTGSVVSFSSDSSGVCREIIEAPQRHTIMARFSDGESIISPGASLVIGNWYYVNGTITYDGVDYTDQTFKAINTNPFTGTGEVIEAMTDQEFQHYEPGIKFTSNNVGDERLGTIIRGNGDPDYDRSNGKEFPINAKFIQVKYIIRVNNLKP